MMTKWKNAAMQSPDPAIRLAYVCGLFAAQRDMNVLCARRETDPEMRQRWVDRARFENLMLIRYTRRLREVTETQQEEQT